MARCIAVLCAVVVSALLLIIAAFGSGVFFDTTAALASVSKGKANNGNGRDGRRSRSNENRDSVANEGQPAEIPEDTVTPWPDIPLLRSRVDADRLNWKRSVRARCISALEPLTLRPIPSVERGEWNKLFTRSVRRGIDVCPDIVPPASDCAMHNDRVFQASRRPRRRHRRRPTTTAAPSSESEPPKKFVSGCKRNSFSSPSEMDTQTASRSENISSGRRILVDLGSARFSSSPTVFLHSYPEMLATFTIHCFDVSPLVVSSYNTSEVIEALRYFLRLPREVAAEVVAKEVLDVTFHQAALWGEGDGFLVYKKADQDNYVKGRSEMMNSGNKENFDFWPDPAAKHVEGVKVARKQDVSRDRSPGHATDASPDAHSGELFTVPAWDVCRFFLEELQVTGYDFVILKLDVEGGEWSILHALKYRCPIVMEYLIDEIFFECHYKEMCGVCYPNTPFSKCRSAWVEMRVGYAVLGHHWT